jgi:hypothetical protein
VVAPAGVISTNRGFLLHFYCISNKYTVKDFPLDLHIFWIYNPDMKTIKKGRGRPPKSSGTTKSESILLRLEVKEKQGFLDAANVAGAPLAVWMRERLRRAAIRELEEAGRPVAFIQPLGED